MIYTVVSVFDAGVSAYGRPVFVAGPGASVRSFQDEVNRAADDNTMFKYPGDFALFKLGTFDDATGRFENCAPQPELLARATDVHQGGK